MGDPSMGLFAWLMPSPRCFACLCLPLHVQLPQCFAGTKHKDLSKLQSRRDHQRGAVALILSTSDTKVYDMHYGNHKIALQHGTYSLHSKAVATSA